MREVCSHPWPGSPVANELLVSRQGQLYRIDPTVPNQSLSQLRVVALTGFPYPAGDPAWSPDGREILFTLPSQGELYMVDANGGVPALIPTPANLQKGFGSFDPVP